MKNILIRDIPTWMARAIAKITKSKDQTIQSFGMNALANACRDTCRRCNGSGLEPR